MKPLNIVITGANRGIGLALAEYSHNLGYKVYGVCRNYSNDLVNVAEMVIDDINLSEDNDYERLKQELKGVKIDILINNAGIMRRSSLSSLNYEDIMDEYYINAIAPLKVTEILLDNISQGGKIGLITSRMGSIADNTSGGRYGYRMSKAALNAAGKSLAFDLKPRNISVGIFHPGYVQTDMTGNTGDITSDIAAKRILNLITHNLNITSSGTFWHSNGTVLPW